MLNLLRVGRVDAGIQRGYTGSFHRCEIPILTLLTPHRLYELEKRKKKTECTEIPNPNPQIINFRNGVYGFSRLIIEYFESSSSDGAMFQKSITFI